MDVDLACFGTVDALEGIVDESERFIAVMIEDATADQCLLRVSSEDTLGLPIVVHRVQLANSSFLQVREQMRQHVTSAIISTVSRVNELIVRLSVATFGNTRHRVSMLRRHVLDL